MIDLSDHTSEVGEETADLSAMSENVFRIASLPENTEDDDKPDTEFASEQQKIEGPFKISKVLVLMPRVQSVFLSKVISHHKKAQIPKESHLRYKRLKVLNHSKVIFSGAGWKQKREPHQ